MLQSSLYWADQVRDRLHTCKDMQWASQKYALQILKGEGTRQDQQDQVQLYLAAKSSNRTCILMQTPSKRNIIMLDSAEL